MAAVWIWSMGNLWWANRQFGSVIRQESTGWIRAKPCNQTLLDHWLCCLLSHRKRDEGTRQVELVCHYEDNSVAIRRSVEIIDQGVLGMFGECRCSNETPSWLKKAKQHLTSACHLCSLKTRMIFEEEDDCGFHREETLVKTLEYPGTMWLVLLLKQALWDVTMPCSS